MKTVSSLLITLFSSAILSMQASISALVKGFFLSECKEGSDNFYFQTLCLVFFSTTLVQQLHELLVPVLVQLHAGGGSLNLQHCFCFWINSFLLTGSGGVIFAPLSLAGSVSTPFLIFLLLLLAVTSILAPLPARFIQNLLEVCKLNQLYCQLGILRLNQLTEPRLGMSSGQPDQGLQSSGSDWLGTGNSTLEVISSEVCIFISQHLAGFLCKDRLHTLGNVNILLHELNTDNLVSLLPAMSVQQSVVLLVNGCLSLFLIVISKIFCSQDICISSDGQDLSILFLGVPVPVHSHHMVGNFPVTVHVNGVEHDEQTVEPRQE